MISCRQILLVTLASLALTAFVAEPQAATNLTTYAVKGVFKESQSGGRMALIAHDRIPGYMDAMTMTFNVKNRAELKTLHPGDHISFRLSVTDSEDWIDEIKNLGNREIVAAPANTGPDDVAQIRPGELIPDCTLTNQDGRFLHVSDLKGKALAVTFFFSRCPLPSFCPRMNNHFLAVQRALESQSSSTNWQLLSISFDPAFDKPEQLKNLVKFYQADTNHWLLATSSSAEIRKFGAAFGLKFWREKSNYSHNLRTVVVDSAGHLQRVFEGNEWQPNELADAMRKAMTVSR